MRASHLAVTREAGSTAISLYNDGSEVATDTER